MEYKNLIGGSISDKISIYNCDCMELLRQTPDNYYSLALVDPPYGIGEDGLKNHSRNKLAQAKKYTPKNWDSNSPEIEYFEELFRVSKNQIIWGANHFIQTISASGNDINSSCWIVWDKDNGENDFADCELAWTSFDTAVRKVNIRWHGMLQHDMKNKEIRIHPTQKPVALYRWILQKYATEGDKILDTHGGSMSSAIACDMNGFDLDICELDTDYFNQAIERFNDYKKQLKLF